MSELIAKLSNVRNASNYPIFDALFLGADVYLKPKSHRTLLKEWAIDHKSQLVLGFTLLGVAFLPG